MNYLAKEYSNEAFQQYGSAIIRGYQDTIEVLKVIIEVGAKMNGKVLNKRFITEVENSMKEQGLKAFVSMGDKFNLGYRSLNIYLENRSTLINGSWVYYDNQIYCRYIHSVEASFLNDEGRIDCAKVEAACNEEIEQACKYIRKWEDAMSNYDKYTEQLKKAVLDFGNAMKGLSDFFTPSQLDKYDWENAVETAEKAAKKK